MIPCRRPDGRAEPVLGGRRTRCARTRSATEHRSATRRPGETSVPSRYRPVARRSGRACRWSGPLTRRMPGRLARRADACEPRCHGTSDGRRPPERRATGTSMPRRSASSAKASSPIQEPGAPRPCTGRPRGRLAPARRYGIPPRTAAHRRPRQQPRPTPANIAGMHTGPQPEAPFRSPAGQGGALVTIAPDHACHRRVHTGRTTAGDTCPLPGSTADRLTPDRARTRRSSRTPACTASPPRRLR